MLGRGLTEDAWSRFGLYRSRDVLERRYFARHGRALSAEKANEIIAHFEQGQQYFTSALSAGVLAGPLEQYYGVLAIARGMILFLTPIAREATLKKSHGLRATLAPDSQIEDIRIVVEEGTFREFLDATKNVERVTVDVPAASFSPRTPFVVVRSIPAPPASASFSMLDLIARIPGVRRQFEEAFGTAACCFSCRVFWLMNMLRIDIRWDRADLPPQETLAKLLSIHPRAAPQGSEAGTAKFAVVLAEGESLYSMVPHVVDAVDSDEQTIVAPFSGGWALSELASYFAAAHALSMLVRYHPTRWARLLSHEKGDRLLPVLEHLQNLLHTEFIKLVLWELERASHYGTLTVWS